MDVSLQVARGVVALEGDELREGDGAAISDKRSLQRNARKNFKHFAFVIYCTPQIVRLTIDPDELLV